MGKPVHQDSDQTGGHRRAKMGQPTPILFAGSMPIRPLVGRRYLALSCNQRLTAASNHSHRCALCFDNRDLGRSGRGFARSLTRRGHRLWSKSCLSSQRWEQTASQQSKITDRSFIMFGTSHSLSPPVRGGGLDFRAAGSEIQEPNGRSRDRRQLREIRQLS
ncbi:uncharacterized protein LY79DRAFT_251856 [Colletotrichum navitas]|uniref:Uncharacterized protein n=1 Tax=Colletotrichum navitas TaxID=681940 RepID=A0AAD8QAL9_9PEZI|nr:uncharacterized protein LY79DRAFT_251856 [Colletotrichum navitas]KAK1598674.1 hypothetical protein LY79DRAFT_251856 [Colletotrichum navitas]